MGRLKHVRRESSHRAVIVEAADRLAERLPGLVEQIVAEIRVKCPEYARIAEDDLAESVMLSTRLGLESVVAPPSDRRQLIQAAHTGRRRAEQGVPLHEVLIAFRTGLHATWNGLVEVVDEEAPEALDLLLRSSVHVWAGGEAQADAATEAYRQAVREMDRQGSDNAQALLEKLFSAAEPDYGVIDAVSAALDLPEHGRYAVVALRHRPGRRFACPTEEEGLRFIWWRRPAAEIGLVVLGAEEPAGVARALAPLYDGHAGISPVVEGLAELNTARRMAELALRTCASDGPELAVLDDRLPAALLTSAPGLARRLGRTALGPLLELDEQSRTLLIETLRQWYDCGGSCSEAAKRLYCHRNTVLNRLHRIEQLTGRSLGHPRHVAELALALDAVRLAGDRSR